MEVDCTACCDDGHPCEVCGKGWERPDRKIIWRWMFVADCMWRRWGCGVEVSLGAWWPHEYSLYLHIGPLLFGFGREEDHAKMYPVGAADPPTEGE